MMSGKDSNTDPSCKIIWSCSRLDVLSTTIILFHVHYLWDLSSLDVSWCGLWCYPDFGDPWLFLFCCLYGCKVFLFFFLFPYCFIPCAWPILDFYWYSVLEHGNFFSWFLWFLTIYFEDLVMMVLQFCQICSESWVKTFMFLQLLGFLVGKKTKFA